jgi:hypothetical protein
LIQGGKALRRILWSEDFCTADQFAICSEVRVEIDDGHRRNNPRGGNPLRG